jgi:serine protease Do
MNRNLYLSGAAFCAVGAIIAGAGGYWARAYAEAGAVNASPAASALGMAPESFADIVQKVAPAVVSIDVVGKATPTAAALQGQGAPFTFRFGTPNGNGDDPDNPFGPFGFDFGQMMPQAPQMAPMRGTASGFFISSDGYILTNNHVVQDAEKITVRTKDGRSLSARLIGRDPATDLAVIRVDGDGFPFVSFEDRAKPRVGDWVVAVGNPFGLGGTATAGIVSALSRRNVGESNYVDYMQIDAPINRGNSGGPTFDIYGRVVGVNTMIYSPSGGSVGIGFDIPASTAASVSRQLIDHGKVVRGYIGATIQTVTPEIADSLGLPSDKGALVAEVVPGGPSDQAGLKSGDLVQSVDGNPIATAEDLTRQVGLAHPGDIVHLQVRRDGRMQDLSLRAGARPSEAALASNPDLQGDGTDADAANGVMGMQLTPNASGGVTIEGVRPGSDAGDKGLARGDVILRAGEHRVATAADLSAAAREARQKGRTEMLVLVNHGGHKLFVPLQVGKAMG